MVALTATVALGIIAVAGTATAIYYEVRRCRGACAAGATYLCANLADHVSALLPKASYGCISCKELRSLCCAVHLLPAPLTGCTLRSNVLTRLTYTSLPTDPLSPCLPVQNLVALGGFWVVMGGIAAAAGYSYTQKNAKQ